MKIWFTSDTHYSHKRIIEYCSRPYVDEIEMDTALLAAWNDRVQDDDVVVHMGDVTLVKPGRLPELERKIKSLKGKKILIAGNHDHKKMRKQYQDWCWVVISQQPWIVGDVLYSHVPPKAIPQDVSLIVHGHSHGSFKRDGYVDVGVDAFNYVPIEATTVLSEKQHSELLVALAGLLK